MIAEVEELSAELRDELAANSGQQHRSAVDPRSVPLRFSTLKAIAQSPAHAYQAVQDQRTESLAIRLGRGTHAMLLGTPVIEYPGIRRGKAWDAFAALHSSMAILSSKEHAHAQAVSLAVQRHPEAARLLLGPSALRESTLSYEINGRACRATPDARGNGVLVELKTTRCADPSRFARDAMYRGYHAQLAWYADAIEHAGGKRPTELYIVAVETVAPYAITVLRLTDRAIEQGRKLCRLWLERFLACEASNAWPGYCESIVDFDVPEDEQELIFPDDETEGAE